MAARAAAPRRLPLLLLGSALATAGLFVALELVLGALGIGDAPPGRASTLRYQHVEPPLLAPAERPDGAPVLATTDRRTPYQTVLVPKPADALRIVVVGGSAVAGLGYGPNVTFPRHLERRLRRAWPEREIEVLNLGVVALSSREVLAIVEDVCASAEPDVLVVYSGNNEFLELHAEHYAAGERSLAQRLTVALTRSNLFGALRNARGMPPLRELSNVEMASADTRVSEAELITQVSLSDEDHERVFDRYEANLERMVAAAVDAGVPDVILCTVASNWRWRGREDLPDGWWAPLVPERGADVDWATALERFDAGAGEELSTGEHDRLFRRAILAERAGLESQAAADYRASMNADPHLRRAVDELAERVRAVAARTDAELFDAVEYLAGENADGVIGFADFYDYVHFTPLGCLRMAEALHGRLDELGALPPDPRDTSSYSADETAWLAELTRDALDVDRWLGLGFDLELVHDRDLWKHAHVVRELRELLDDPDPERRFHALAWLGNHEFFLVGREDAARALYEAALETRNDAVVRRNLEKLTTTRKP